MPMSRSSARFGSVRLLVACLGLLALACVVLAYPKPAAVPRRWELNFTPGPCRLYVDESTGRAYWYFTYMVVNRTERDRIWAPTLTFYTDSGEILQAGRGVPSRVTDDLMELLANPLLERQNTIIGEIHQGEEHAKEGLVVWPARHVLINEASLFVAGLSGETARVINPVSGEEVILRKTLQRDYIIRGDALARGSEPLELVEERWIMR